VSGNNVPNRCGRCQPTLAGQQRRVITGHRRAQRGNVNGHIVRIRKRVTTRVLKPSLGHLPVWHRKADSGLDDANYQQNVNLSD
jgi:hypothetical protein